MDNPDAHRKFFELMLSVLRIVNAIVLNYRTDQTLSSSLEFLTENRQSVVGILKRFARVGGINADGGIDLSDLVDNLALLISATDFLAVSWYPHHFQPHLICNSMRRARRRKRRH
jgi:nuclear pore complex protein Nup205